MKKIIIDNQSQILFSSIVILQTLLEQGDLELELIKKIKNGFKVDTNLILDQPENSVFMDKLKGDFILLNEIGDDFEYHNNPTISIAYLSLMASFMNFAFYVEQGLDRLKFQSVMATAIASLKHSIKSYKPQK